MKNGHLALVLEVEYMGGGHHAHANCCHDAHLQVIMIIFMMRMMMKTMILMMMVMIMMMSMRMVVMSVMMTMMVLVSNQETKFVLVRIF